MVLEAIEDHLRGWKNGKSGLGGERVARGKLTIEHVLPRKWGTHWPHPDGDRGEVEREAIINTIGNLTLLTSKLNIKVSNGPWLSENGKRHGLKAHNVFFLNHALLDAGGQDWGDAAIRARSDELAQLVTEIWPVPTGHRSGFTAVNVVPRRRVDLSELLSAGCLTSGMSLAPRSKKHAAVVATLLSDGRLDVQGKIYGSPSEAAKAVVGGPMNGWAFFLVDPRERRSLKHVRKDYLASIAAEFDEEDDGDGEDDSD